MLCYGQIARRSWVAFVVASAALLGAAADAGAALVSIEPDHYVVDTDLTNVSPYVTLLTYDGADVIPQFEVLASLPNSNVEDLAPTGELVFSHTGIPFWDTIRQLQLDFNGTTSQVNIAFAGGIPTALSTARLEVYDAAGNLLGVDVSDPTPYAVFDTLSIARPQADIARARIYGGFGDFVRLDALSFATPVPEPTAVGLCTMLGGGLLMRRRSPRPTHRVRSQKR